jgi:hypothetical protein
MAKLDNPPEFNDLTAFFLQYAEDLYSSVEEMIDDGWESLDPKQRVVARDFLDLILSESYSEEQLREIWRASRAAISPFRGQRGSCRKLLELVRSRFEINKESHSRTD